MPTLREMIDGTTISAAAPVASKPSPTAAQTVAKPATMKAPTGKASPIASHISNHMQDPVGSTKDAFGKLTQSKLQYDQAREETQRNLAPVQSVIDHLSQMHNLDPRLGQGTPGMMPNQDNTGVPGVPGAEGNDDQTQAVDENGNPINMSQTVGKLNQSRPSQAGFSPGVAPGDGQTVRPPKMGMAQPGKPGAQNAPQPRGSGNQQYAPAAAPPKGSKQLPGAKGPGDPKVANRTKKAQNGQPGAPGSRGNKGGVNITVHSAACNVIGPSSNNISAMRGLDKLRTIHAGPAALSDKATGSGTEESYNPYNPSMSVKSKGKKVSKMKTGKMKKCEACGQMHAEGKCRMDAGGPGSGRHPGGATNRQKEAMQQERIRKTIQTYPRRKRMLDQERDSMEASGTSKGAKHRLSTRGQKHLSKKEKMAHWQTMDAGGPGSGRKPGFRTTGKNPTHYTTMKRVGGKLQKVKLPYDREGGKFSDKMSKKGYSQGTF